MSAGLAPSKALDSNGLFVESHAAGSVTIPQAVDVCPKPQPSYAVTSSQLAHPSVISPESGSQVPPTSLPDIAAPCPALGRHSSVTTDATANADSKELTGKNDQELHLTCSLGGATLAKVALTSSENIEQAVRQALEDSASLVKLQMQEARHPPTEKDTRTDLNPRRSVSVDSSGEYIVHFNLSWDMSLSTGAAVETMTMGRTQPSRGPATVAVLSGSDQPSRGRQTTGGQPQPSPNEVTRAQQARVENVPPPTIEQTPTRTTSQPTFIRRLKRLGGILQLMQSKEDGEIFIHSESSLGKTGKSQPKRPRLAATRSLPILQYNNLHNLDLPLSNDVQSGSHLQGRTEATDALSIAEDQALPRSGSIGSLYDRSLNEDRTHNAHSLQTASVRHLPLQSQSGNKEGGQEVASVPPSTCQTKPPSGYASNRSAERGSLSVGLETESLKLGSSSPSLVAVHITSDHDNPTPLHNILTLSEGSKVDGHSTSCTKISENDPRTSLCTASGAPKAKPTHNQVSSQAYVRPKKRSIWRRIRRLFRCCLPSYNKVGVMDVDIYMVPQG